MASYPFFEIELENEYDPEPQLGDSILLPDSIMTPASPPDFNLFPESILDPVSIHNEIESSIFDDHHIELDQFQIDKFASSHFYEIELNEICDLDSQIQFQERDNLPNCQCHFQNLNFGQVQMVVLKRNLVFQNIMILRL